MKTFITLAALAAATLVAPAFAQDTELGAGPQVVTYTDLDLTTAHGVRTLDRRIELAARQACGWASDIDIAGQNDMRRCRKQTVAEIAARRSQAIDNARQPQLALNDARR
ncbi:MAG: UrcA family protein [Pseudomonadota bacterium]|uniref:UrcA family protein n=1 Tax=Sphingomonas sp. ERG5 TaxID=1381597 RepID=UPI00068BF6B1|nr:UrcA family protein [Sphingomonas sp. ERG5]